METRLNAFKIGNSEVKGHENNSFTPIVSCSSKISRPGTVVYHIYVLVLDHKTRQASLLITSYVRKRVRFRG